MTERELKLVIGSLLHDIGKVIYRTGDGRKHSKSGYDYLKEEIRLDDNDILESVLYHHADALRNSAIDNDSLAYITYIADNIASATDRRENEDGDYGFEVTLPLMPVFNILNHNSAQKYYSPGMIDENINFPTDEKKMFDENFYKKVKVQISDCLRAIDLNNSEKYINSLLEILEATLGFVPSSTNKKEQADISLYDHVKLTAAISSCIYKYLMDKGIDDYSECLWNDSKSFYDENAFMLFSMDVSGIQKFIYTIKSEDALKSLRARSFYLEFMTEHIIDELLEELELCRVNLLYSGGGHCYMLLPNTEKVKKTVDDFEKRINQWLMDKFDISLYVAMGYCPASSNSLQNKPDGSYAQLYKTIGNIISKKKSNRYSAADIIKLNTQQEKEYARECSVCKRRDNLNEENKCHICEGLIKISKNILNSKFFVVYKGEVDNSLPLPGDMYLSTCDKEDQLREIIKSNGDFVRAYSKNKRYSGLNVATKIWVGNYSSSQSFDELEKHSKGIKRLAILRADVDNLGQAFVKGFSDKYNTLSRTATLSRHLSLFFKYYINSILKNGVFGIEGEKNEARNATIVYSGGDDVFIAGAWNDVIELAVDIQKCLEKYTEGTLSISAGINLYSSGYPISEIAKEVGILEDVSKHYQNQKTKKEKSAVTVFSDYSYSLETQQRSIQHGTYNWNVFEKEVIGEKFKTINQFISSSDERGMNFLYNLLELIRDADDKLNFARYVYVLSRLEPQGEDKAVQREQYKMFSKKMYEWIQDEEDRKQLKTAMNICSLLNRKTEEDL